jgi:hypothetical protein
MDLLKDIYRMQSDHNFPSDVDDDITPEGGRNATKS